MDCRGGRAGPGIYHFVTKMVEWLLEHHDYCGLNCQAAQHHAAIYLLPMMKRERIRTQNPKKLLRLGHFNRTEKERKISVMIEEYTKQVMCNAVAHHLLTDAQPDAMQLPPSWPTTLAFIAEYGTSKLLLPSMEHPSGSQGQLPWLYPLLVHSQLPCWKDSPGS